MKPLRRQYFWRVELKNQTNILIRDDASIKEYFQQNALQRAQQKESMVADLGTARSDTDPGSKKLG